MPLIILIFNGLLALVSLLNMYQAVAQVRILSQVQYSSFLQLYAFVVTLEFSLLMFIMPALTSGSISGERERQTLELLFTTKMTPSDIVTGKLFSAFGQLLVLVVSSFPVLFVTFVYGSVDFLDLGLLMVCYVTVAVFAGGIGVLFSSLMRRSTFSNVCTYGVLLLIAAGTLMLNLFLLNMSSMQIRNMVVPLGETRPVADSGGAVYLLLFNPVMTFCEILRGQVSGITENISLERFLGSRPDNFVTQNWVFVSIGLQIAVSLLLIWGAIRILNPIRNEKN